MVKRTEIGHKKRNRDFFAIFEVYLLFKRTMRGKFHTTPGNVRRKTFTKHLFLLLLITNNKLNTNINKLYDAR